MAMEMDLLNALRQASSQLEAVLMPTGQEGDFDSLSVDFPFVVRYEGQWRLFYTGFDGQHFRVGMARSEDLQSWQREGIVLDVGSANSFDAGGVSASWILRHNDFDEPMPKMRRGLFWMAYLGSDEPKKTTGDIGLAFSSDLHRWERFEANPVFSPKDGDDWERKGLTTPCLLEREHLFWLFYAVHDGSSAIGLALSHDFLVWSRDLENPLVHLDENCYRPFIFRYRGQWQMLFSSPDGIRCAVSDDLRRWKVLDEPVLTMGESNFIGNPCLLWHNGTLSLFFTAQGDERRGIFCVQVR